MAEAIAFESKSEKLKQRQFIREQREKCLTKAKKDYDRKQRDEEQRKLRGEDNWMLPSVSQRISEESMSCKKHKKHKKEKKHKKKKKKKDSDSESDDEPQWVEKDQTIQQKHEESVPPIKGPQLQRDDWMAAPMDLIPTVSRDELRRRIKEDKKEKEPVFDEIGQHERELNPYWKGGGTGLPEEEKKAEKDKPMSNQFGDGGATWLKKAYQRCVEQAKEEGRTLESIAAERYGSLEKLEALIAQSEETQSSNRRRVDRRKSRSRSQERRPRSRSRDRHREGGSREKSHKHSRNNSGSSDDSSLDRRNKRSRRSPEKSPDNSQRGQRSRSPYSKRVTSSSRFMKPDVSDDRTSSSRGKSRFMRPGEMSDRTRSRSDNVNHQSSWRKAGYEKPASPSTSSSHSSVKQDSKREKQAESANKIQKSTNSSSDSSEDSSDSEVEEKRSSPPPKILGEQEMNAIGAKIIKLELMGQQDMADKLKSQLDLARQLKTNVASSSSQQTSRVRSEKEEASDDNVAVLMRSDRSGNVRPLPSRDTPQEPKGGRRKKQKVATHDVEGDRERYFADDDNYDLKQLVERERLGTAEDSNLMFARLAGKSIERTDDDHQIDDVFMQRANKKESKSKEYDRQRTAAIGEHKLMSDALSKCQLCLEKYPKHLIIAIGIKTFLCLPNYRQLNEGHCLIVPIQHIAASTVVDEDVWTEMKVFRKGLTKMFADREEDIVFMETSMHLKYQPHMCVECIPLSKELGDMAPIYFKKAIMETGSEWAQNKKVVDLSQKDIRHAVPKGFPYFSVDFGLQGGYAHVIEDEKEFPRYFGKEIIGGMLDVEPRLWRKQQKESFDQQRKNVLQFAEWWKPYDWTLRLKEDD
ncbi:CWF19-like protein 2 [Tubulanus polymorphus]|uniref:CWF19-like protein 2 n=1 Tax=Tubulanus polymorphus TaxID=672921 RepID=UPI003DA64C33